MMTPVCESYLAVKNRQFWLKSDVEITEAAISTLLSNKANASSSRLADIHTILSQLFTAEVKSITPMQDGTFCLAFAVMMANDQEYVIKTSLLDIPYISHDFYLEKQVMNCLTARGLPSYPVHTVNCTRLEYSFDYMIMHKVSGISFAHLASQSDYLRRLGHLLAELHCSTDIIGYGPLVNTQDGPFQGLKNTWHDYIFTKLDAHLHYCLTQQILNAAQCREIAALFSNLPLNRQTCLLHGDLSNANIIVQADNSLVLIDWGDALSGDPVFDIAMWGSFIGNQERLASLLAGYQTIAGPIIDFNLRYWLYYLRIILAKTVHRHRFQYYKTDKIPAISRILLPVMELRKLM